MATPMCAAGEVGDTGALPLVAPGDIRVRVAPSSDAVAVRAGVNGGMATALISLDEVRSAVEQSGANVQLLVLHDEARDLRVIGQGAEPGLA